MNEMIRLAALAGFCAAGATPVLADDIDDAKAAFAAAYAEECSWALGGSPDMSEPEVMDFTYRYEFDDAETPDRAYRLYRFFCNQGAYNQTHAYFAGEEYSGIVPVQFAVPAYDVEYEDGDSDKAVLSITVTGMTTQKTLTNSEVDAETGLISQVGYWRGIGDASSAGTWRFDRGQFVLVTYDVDASYDGEVTPERLVDYTTAQ